MRVPEPAAFALHKYILSTIRKHTSKKAPKDLQTAQELSRFLLTQENQLKKLKTIHDEMPKKWQKKTEWNLNSTPPGVGGIFKNLIFARYGEMPKYSTEILNSKFLLKVA